MIMDDSGVITSYATDEVYDEKSNQRMCWRKQTLMTESYFSDANAGGHVFYICFTTKSNVRSLSELANRCKNCDSMSIFPSSIPKWGRIFSKNVGNWSLIMATCRAMLPVVRKGNLHVKTKTAGNCHRGMCGNMYNNMVRHNSDHRTLASQTSVDKGVVKLGAAFSSNRSIMQGICFTTGIRPEAVVVTVLAPCCEG